MADPPGGADPTNPFEHPAVIAAAAGQVELSEPVPFDEDDVEALPKPVARPRTPPKRTDAELFNPFDEEDAAAAGEIRPAAPSAAPASAPVADGAAATPPVSLNTFLGSGGSSPSPSVAVTRKPPAGPTLPGLSTPPGILPGSGTLRPQRYLGGKLLLQKIIAQAPAAMGPDGGADDDDPGPAGDDGASPAASKGIFAQFTAFKRRTEQRIAEAVGATDSAWAAAVDPDFGPLWAGALAQEASLKSLLGHAQRYMEATAAAAESARGVAHDLAALVVGEKDLAAAVAGGPLAAESLWHATGEGAARRREAALRALRTLESHAALATRAVPTAVGVHLTAGVITPCGSRAADVPAYAPCLAKRADYLRDYGAYHRKVATIKEQLAAAVAQGPAGAKAAEKLAERLARNDGKLAAAEKRFRLVAAMVNTDLQVLESSRFDFVDAVAAALTETELAVAAEKVALLTTDHGLHS